MKDLDVNMIFEFQNVNGSALMPISDNAEELLQNTSGKRITLKEVTARDLKYHRAYFALMGFIYQWMTPAFKTAVPEAYFYKFVKHLQGKYQVVFEFKDGTKMIEYESISFGRMTQVRFSEYVREQLPIIYSDLIGVLYKNESEVSMIIETIEAEFETYLDRL